MQNVQSLSQDIKAARLAAKITLAELSSRTGIPTRSLSRIEAADPSAPIGRILQVLAALGLALSIEKSARPTLESLSSLYAEDDGDTLTPTARRTK